MRVNGNLTMVGQIRNFRPENLTNDPVSPLISRLWYNTTEGVFKYYDNANNIQVLSTGAGSITEYLKLDGTSAMTGELTLSSNDQSAAAATSAISKGYLDTVAATKQDNLTGATSELTDTNLDNSKAVVSDASGKIISATSTTAAEIEFLAGVTSAIQTQIDSKEASLGYAPVDRAGDSMTGNLAMSGNKVTGLGQPTNANDAVRLSDLEARMTGLDFQADVLAIQADNTLDPAGPTEGDRYLITDAGNVSAAFSGIAGLESGDIVVYNGTDYEIAYDVSAQGSGALLWDRDTATFQYYDGTNWSQFGGLDALNAGVGLTRNGNTVDVLLGAGIGQLPTDEVGVDASPDGGLFNTIDGTTESSDTAARLAIKVDAAGGMETTNDGLKVKSSGIVEGMLNASIVGNGLQGAAGSALSVLTPASSGLTVDGTGVSVDDTEMRNRVLYRDGAEAMTGVLTLSSSDQSGDGATAAISKGHLDSEIATINTAISELSTRSDDGYFLYEETTTPATTHTVTHNMGIQFPSVTVIDSSDEVVIPQSISFTDANSLVVTFAQAETCRVVAVGKKVAV